MGRRITLAHSPDSDDAFMFYALARGKIDSRGLDVTHVLKDIQALNDDAAKGVYDVTAISFHAFPRVMKTYALTRAGSSVGDGYGPLIVSKQPRFDLSKGTVAVPGKLTTAYLALQLYRPGLKTIVVPFDKIPEAVANDEADAGLLIHEGQLTYGDLRLHKVADLGEWWKRETGLPLPLGGNAVRRSLDEKTRRDVNSIIRDSVRWALENREEALDHALSYGRGLDRGRGDRFVGMYVNDFTLDLGDRGEAGLRQLMKRGYDAGIILDRADLEFVG
ncbi:MAG TPA: MqnA/MqnD/SBP family protein [Planctomycetota bacterium]|nr:MqnA/MqnD/SBP family protein [Planctomycetota bacterium]